MTLADQYARGSALYNQIEATQGTAAADAAWQAAINAEKNGTPLPDSTLGVLATQSPADWVNNSTDYWTSQAESVGSNIFGNIITKPFVLIGLLLVGVIVFLYLGGGKLLKK